MAIVAMKRLRLIGLRSQQKQLLRQLRQLGCVQIEPQPTPEEGTLLRQPDPQALEAAVNQAQSLEAALALLKREVPHKTGLLTPRRQVDEARLFDDDAYAHALQTAEALGEASARRSAAQAQRGKLEAQRMALAPWLELPVPLELSGTRDTTVLLGGVPRRMTREGLTDRLSGAAALYTLTWAGEDRENRYFMLCFHNTVREPVTAVLNEVGFNRMSFPGVTGTAAENDRRLQAALEEQEAAIQAAQGDILAHGAERAELELALDRAQQEINLERAAQNLLDTPNAFCLSGWLPADREKALAQALEGYTVAWETAKPAPEEYPQVPIKLKNGPIAAAMNPITEMYSLPVYTGVDPNPWMAPFFILFFGFMMNDIAYGLLMVLGTALYLKMARPKESKRNFMMLFLLCGISSVFWGALTGSFFGDFIPTLTGILGHRVELPSLFTPMGDTIMVMIGSLVLGAIQVFTGMAISVGHKLRRGEGWDALFNEVSWWIILAAGAWAILGGGTPALAVLAVGGLMLLVGGTRKAKGFGKVTSAVGIIYNGVSGFFSDILSYVRLMALMLSGSVIASVFNTLGATFNSVIPFLLISLVGNALALVLNLLGCYVHTLRLQCLEFFGRFYEEGGRPFKPLAVDTNYVEVMKEEQ